MFGLKRISSRLVSMFKIRLFSGFLMSRIIVIVNLNIIGDILSPAFTKLYGENLNVSTIAIISLVLGTTGLFQPFARMLRKEILITCTNLSYLGMMLAIVLYLLGILNVYYYIALDVLASFVCGVVVSAFDIRISDYISKKYADDFQDFLVTKEYLVTVFDLLSIVLVGLIAHIFGINVLLIMGAIAYVSSCILFIWSCRYLTDLDELCLRNGGSNEK